MAKHKKTQQKSKTHTALFDRWSLVHLASGIAAGWLINPFIALAVTILWEPVELFILSPLFGHYGMVFGDESLQNSLSDIFFDAVGVGLGAWALTALVLPPFHIL